MPAFSPAIAAIVSPRKAWWSSEIGDHGHRRAEITLVREPSAETCFEQHNIGRCPGKGEQGRRRRDLEIGIGVPPLAASHSSSNAISADQLSYEADALVVAPDAARYRRARDTARFEAGARLL
jgi:hypothetical protein